VRVIDSHVHFWRIGGPGQTWPDAQLPLLYRDFGPAELAEAVSGAMDLQGLVLVQSQPDDRDTDWILEIARDTPVAAAVVGWVDLSAPTAPARIAELSGKPKLRGLRPMLQAIDDTAWILRRELEPALQTMTQHDLRFDALIQPRHLPAMLEFARRWPTLRIVIDHGAKPHIALGELEPWQAQLAELSLLPNIWCKLSGLRTEQAAGVPRAELEPYIRQLVTCFPGRLMWGSDWPVLLQARDSYSDWLQCAQQYAGIHGETQLDSLFSGAARSFYGLA
jgi:L-fuconolactonase